MQILNLRKLRTNANDKAGNSQRFVADSTFKDIKAQFITPHDGRLIADIPDITENGRLILMENSVIFVANDNAYKFNWDELTIEWIEPKNPFYKLFTKGKIRISSKHSNSILDNNKPNNTTLTFAAGEVQYKRGLRTVKTVNFMTESIYTLIKGLKGIIKDLQGIEFIQRSIIFTDSSGKEIRHQFVSLSANGRLTFQILFITEDTIYIVGKAINGVAKIPITDIDDINLLERTGFLRKDNYIEIITKSGPKFYFKDSQSKVKHKTQELFKVLDAWRI